MIKSKRSILSLFSPVINKTMRNMKCLDGPALPERWQSLQTRAVAPSRYHASGVGTHLLHSTCAMSPSSAEGSSSRLLPYVSPPCAYTHQVTHFFLLVISMATDKSLTLRFSHLGCSAKKETVVAQTRGTTLILQHIRFCSPAISHNKINY